MINSRAVPVPLPAHTGVSPTRTRHDFADPLSHPLAGSFALALGMGQP